MGESVRAAVLTVPNAINSTQRSSLKRAAHKAGLSDVKLISENAAAAIMFNSQLKNEETILVYDLGGGKKLFYNITRFPPLTNAPFARANCKNQWTGQNVHIVYFF